MRPHFCFLHNGEATVHYNGVKYIYSTDAIYHERWKKEAIYKPMKVWNKIKKAGKLIYRDPPLPEKPKIQLEFVF
jgi:hypothetical protein